MCLIGDIHHLSWKPLGENIIQLLGLVGLFHHRLASSGSHRICSDLSPPCFPQLCFKRGDPDLLGRPLLGFRAAVAGWHASWPLLPASPSPFTVAFCCQFLTGEFLHGWPVGKAVPNCLAMQPLTGR